MSARRLRSEAKASAADVGNEAGNPRQLGKRSSSDSQDVTPTKKTRTLKKTDIKSQIFKRKHVVQKKKTILSRKKKSQELSEKEHSDKEENTSILDGKEETSETFVCLSENAMEIDCPHNVKSVSDNSLEEKQTNPLQQENEMQVTQSDETIEMKSSSLNKVEESTQSQVKDILSKDESKEDITICDEDKTLFDIKFYHSQEDNSSTNTEIVSEGLSEHHITSLSKDDSNKVFTDSELQEKNTCKENVFQNIKAGDINDCTNNEVTNKTEEIAILDNALTQAGTSSELILSNKDQIEFKETVCDNTIKPDLVDKRELITNENKELKNSDEAQTQAGMGSEQTLPNKDKLEFEDTVCDKIIETGNSSDLGEEMELIAHGNEELKDSDEPQTQDGMSSKQSLSNKDKMEFKETVCGNIIEAGNVNDLGGEMELSTNGNEKLKISDETQTQDGMSSELIFSNKDKMEFKKPVFGNTSETVNINDLVQEKELGTHGNEELKVSDEPQTQDGMSSEQSLSNEDKMEFKETVCEKISEIANVNDLLEERMLVTNTSEELKISGEARTQASTHSEQFLPNEEKMVFKETVCDNMIESGNINDLVIERELGTHGNEELKVLDEPRTQDGMNSEQSLPKEDNLELKETVCRNTIESVNKNDLVEERELVTNQNDEDMKISNEVQAQAGMSSEESLSKEDNMELKETVCGNTIESANKNDLVEERELVTNQNEDMKNSNEVQAQARMSSEQSLSKEDNMELKETVCGNTIEYVNKNDLVEERELVTNQNEELKISNEVHAQAGMSSKQIHRDINKTEPKETVFEGTIKTENIADFQKERELGTEGSELQISDESQTKHEMNSEQSLSNEVKMEFKETDNDNIMVTGITNELVERKLITIRNEELKISDEAQTEAGMSSEQGLSNEDKTEFKETDADNIMVSGNFNKLVEERELITIGNKELKISDEAQTEAGIISEQSLSNEDKMEFKETDDDNNMVIGNINELIQERKLITIENKELKISDEVQTEAGISEQSLSNKDKMEFKETDNDKIMATGNIDEFVEERELITIGNEEFKILDEVQTEAGMSSKQGLSNEDKMEFKETDCDNIKTKNSRPPDCQEEGELSTSQTDELEILDGSLTQADISSEQNLSDKEEIKYKETICMDTIETGKTDDCLEKRELFINESDEFEISDKPQTHTGNSSEQILLVEEKMEHKDDENIIGTEDDCQEEMELVIDLPEQMEISDEEDTIKQFSDENVIRSQSPEREKYQYKLPAMDDPVWKDRLPPPPGCESPPPYPPPLAPKPIAPPAPAIAPMPVPRPATPHQYNVNSTLDIAKILKSATKNASGQLEIEFEISHLPQFTVDYVVKKCVRENQIKAVSGATVRTRGQYVAPGTTTTVAHMTGHGPHPFLLCLIIKGPSRESLETALTCVKNLIAEGEEDEDVKMIKVFGLQHAPPEFNQNDRLKGEGGANLLYISEHTGAEVTLRGQSSGYLEASGTEAPWPLHLRIRHKSSEGLLKAKEIASHLIQTVTKEFKELYNPSQQSSVQSVGQVTTAVRSALVPTIVPAPEVTSPHTTPTPVLPPSQSSPWSLQSSLSGSRVLTGSNTTPIVPFAPAILTPFAVNPLNPLAYFETVSQLANQTRSSSKVIYESGPQLKNQKTSNISLNSSTSNASQTPFQFARPPPPMPRPHPRPSLAVSTSNIPVPPPLKNPPSATPLHLRPSFSIPTSPEVRNALTFRPKNKNGENNTEVKNSPTSKKAGKKPKKIQFSIITAAKNSKMVSGNPMIQKKTSEAERSTTNKASGAETKNSSFSEKNRQKTSRWGLKQEELPQSNKTKQLMEKLNDEINIMPSGGDKFRLTKIFNLLQIAVPQAHELNDKDRAQLKMIKEILEKTRDYLPSNQLSKTLRELLTALKTDFNILTDEESSSEPQNLISTSNNRTCNQQVVMNDGKAHNDEADARETTKRRETTRSRETSRRQETSRKREKESQKSSSSTSKHFAHTSRSHSQEFQSRREFHKFSSIKASDLRKSGSSTQEQKRRGGSPKTSSDKQSRKIKEQIQSASSNQKPRSEMFGEKQEKTLQSEVSTPKPSRSHLRGELNKTIEPSSGASTQEQKLGDSLKNFLESSNRNANSEMYGEKQESKTMKSEVLSPKPSKSPLSGELNKVVQLMHRALKTATNSVENNSVKLELSKISQLLEHALPTGIEVSDEQKSQFLIILDVLDHTLQRNSSALGQESVHLTSIISLLKGLLHPSFKTVNTFEKDNIKSSLIPSNATHLTHISSEARHLPETKVKNELADQQSDQLFVISCLLQKAIKTYADTLRQGIMKTRLIAISQSLEEAASKSGKSTQKEQSNLLQIIELLEQLLTTNQLLPSQQPKELLGIMQQLKHVLESTAFGGTTNIQHNVSKPVDKMKMSLTNEQTLNTPTNQSQSQLLQIIQLLQKALHSYCASMEQGYLKSQLAQISQMLDRELQEHVITMSPEKLKKQMSPLIQLLHQLLQNQSTSNHESKQLIQILQHIEKTLNPPVTMNQINPQASNLLGNLQQLQMLQTLQQQMQGGSQLSMGLPFQPMQMQAAPIANNFLQLQLMQVMQQMQAALGSQSQQPENPVSNQLNQLSQQLQTLQQQFTQVSQLNQQQPFQTATVPQQQSLLQSLSAAGPQSFMQPATMTQPQANLSDLMLQIQQASQEFKSSK